MRAIFLLLFAALSWVAAAQTPDGISAPASRTLALTADEADFTITVAATLDSTEQQVKQALQSAGLPNPTVVATGLGQDTSTYPPGAAQILYSATVAIPSWLGLRYGQKSREPAFPFAIPAPEPAILRCVQPQPGHSGCHASGDIAATPGRFPQVGAVARGGRGSQIGNYPVDQRFGRRPRGHAKSGVHIRSRRHLPRQVSSSTQRSPTRRPRRYRARNTRSTST